MKTLKKFLLLFFPLLLLPKTSQSQKLIADSLVLDLSGNLAVLPKASTHIDTVLDIREIKDARLIGISEIKHYGIVPVDYYIKADKPLTEIMQQVFLSEDSTKQKTLSLGLKHFEFSAGSKLWLFKEYRLRALLEIYKRVNPDSLSPIGELLFDSESKEFFTRAKLKKGYEKVFGIWCQELTKNLAAVSSNLKSNQHPLPYNFRKYQLGSPWMQLFTGTDFVYFQNGFLIDGYLSFTYPETKRLFSESAAMIRFRRDKKFDSIEYGLMNGSLNYRLNYSILFRFKYDLFLGINRWKDMNVEKHTAYDALIGDVSFSQNFLYFPIHKSTLFFGFGIFQNLYYVYSKDFQLFPGLIIKAGLLL